MSAPQKPYEKTLKNPLKIRGNRVSFPLYFPLKMV